MRDSRSVILAEESGYVEYADSKRIIVKYDVDESAPETLVCFDDERRVEHLLTKFSGINQETCFNQKPVVVTGQKLKKGDIIADSPGIEKGELALAVTFLLHSCRGGYNFEDAIVLSERLVVTMYSLLFILKNLNYRFAKQNEVKKN